MRRFEGSARKSVRGTVFSSPFTENVRGTFSRGNLVTSTKKKASTLSVLFSTKSTLAGGWNRLPRWNPTSLGEIRLDGEWVDLISSEAKPKISSALADFILASARISFMQEFEFIRNNTENIFFVAHRQWNPVRKLVLTGFFFVLCYFLLQKVQHSLSNFRFFPYFFHIIR